MRDFHPGPQAGSPIGSDSVGRRRSFGRAIGLICLCLSLGSWIFPTAARACDLLPHEWVMARQQTTTEVAVCYAFADALFQCRRQMETEFSSAGRSASGIVFAGCFLGNPRGGLPTSARQALEEAIGVVWPSTKAGFQWQTGLSLDDHAGLVKVSQKVAASYTAFVQIKEAGRQEIDLVDGVFYLWACMRLVRKETATMFVKVLDQKGQTVFLDEFKVSPTVLAEVIMTPLGCFLGRLEKRNSKPAAMFFESVKPGVHGLFFQTEFPPESGVPPLSGRDLPLPGVSLTPQPPVVFFDQASGTIGK